MLLAWRVETAGGLVPLLLFFFLSPFHKQGISSFQLGQEIKFHTTSQVGSSNCCTHCNSNRVHPELLCGSVNLSCLYNIVLQGWLLLAVHMTDKIQWESSSFSKKNRKAAISSCCVFRLRWVGNRA